MAAFEGLPEDLTSLILVKLPVKSLLRCKCVRKSWYTLIKSPQFIRLHCSSSSPQLVIRRRIEEGPILHHRYVLSFHSNETLADLGNDDIDTSFPFLRSDLGIEVSLSGSCDGLVCIHNHYDTDYRHETDQILIYNPAIRELRSLFVPPSSCYHIDSVAFGADLSTGQHKVVMIGLPLDDYDCGREAQVYDFSTDSWRETGIVVPDPFSCSRRAVSLNGAFHWCPDDDSDNILTFHISDEVAGSIPMPDFVDSSWCKELYVSSESQQLALVEIDWEGRYQIWVMTEYGAKESWTRLFQIGPLLNIISFPLAFWGEPQQLLLLTNQGHQLVSCDLQHPSLLRYFPIFGDFDDNDIDVRMYSESLVSVHGSFGQ